MQCFYVNDRKIFLDQSFSVNDLLVFLNLNIDLIVIEYNKIILQPGQILYIPPFYWHAIRNIDNTIAFTYHYYTIYSFFTIDIPDTIFYIYNIVCEKFYGF